DQDLSLDAAAPELLSDPQVLLVQVQGGTPPPLTASDACQVAERPPFARAVAKLASERKACLEACGRSRELAACEVDPAEVCAAGCLKRAVMLHLSDLQRLIQIALGHLLLADIAIRQPHGMERPSGRHPVVTGLRGRGLLLGWFTPRDLLVRLGDR